MMKKRSLILFASMAMMMLMGCRYKSRNLDEKRATSTSSQYVNMKIGPTNFTMELYKNEAVDEFVKMLQKSPLTLNFEDYAGFEKVAFLGTTLTSNDQSMTTTSGDIVLYNGNQFVIFYGSNVWHYTKLGKVTDLSNWQEALGNESVTITFSLEQ